MGGGWAFVQLPLSHLSGTALFLFSSLLKPFSFWRMCAASPSNVAPGGVQEHSSPEETQGPLVAGCRARSKVGMKGGICGPFSFRPKKALSISELHCTSKSAKIPKHQNKPHAHTAKIQQEMQVHCGGLQCSIWCFTCCCFLVILLLLTCILHFHLR